MKKLLAAVATTDDINVNQHFGRAAFFKIYSIDKKGISFEGARDVIAACQHKMSHDITDFERVIKLLSDCDFLVVEKIGPGAAEFLIQKGVRVFEAQGSINTVLIQIYNNFTGEQNGL